ncbi:itaconate transport protein-like [Venturia nashicola]|nr:itaconate transport protein-like [Venturia nashicola]
MSAIKLDTFEPSLHSPKAGPSEPPSRTSFGTLPLDNVNDEASLRPVPTCIESLRHIAPEGEQAPYHVFTSTMKNWIVFNVSAVAALSGLSSNIYFPAQENISVGLSLPMEVVNLSITTYMIAQGLAPSFWAPLADRQGRRTTLMYTLLLYVGANVALALTTNSAMLLVFRALQAAGSSSTIALGAGVIADIAAPHERGGYLGWFSGVRQLSLALGPVIGGLLAGSVRWRSIFWFLTAFSSLCVVGVLLLIPETLRRIAGNGEVPLEHWYYRPLLWSFLQNSRTPNRNLEDQTAPRTVSAEIKPAKPFSFKIFIRPFKLLCEWDALCALLFGGCVYTAWSMMVASTTYLLKDIYQFSTIQIGLCFLANGFGCIIGSISAGRYLNYDYRREAQLWQFARHIHPDTPLPSKVIPTSFPLEKARLGKGYVYTTVTIWSLLLFGWSLTAPGPSNDPKSHWIVPLLAQFAAGWGATSVLTSNNTLLVDSFPDDSASASAILNLSRCLMAAGGVAGVDPFLRACGPGWLSVLLVGIVVVGVVPYGLHSFYGQRWREDRATRNGCADPCTPGPRA